MSITRKPPGARPGLAVLLTLPEISGQCICTWVTADYRKDGQSRSTLKYRNTSCPAVVFHRGLQAATEQP